MTETCANCGEPIVFHLQEDHLTSSGIRVNKRTWYHLTGEVVKVGLFRRRMMAEVRRECEEQQERMVARPQESTCGHCDDVDGVALCGVAYCMCACHQDGDGP